MIIRLLESYPICEWFYIAFINGRVIHHDKIQVSVLADSWLRSSLGSQAITASVGLGKYTFRNKPLHVSQPYYQADRTLPGSLAGVRIAT
jgi:hypothetical protein